MIIDLTSTPHGPYSTLRRPHIDPTSTPHRLHIDSTSTSTNTQLLFQPSFVVKLYSSPPPPPTTSTFLFFSLHHHFLIFTVFLSDKLFRRSDGPKQGSKSQMKAKRRLKGPKKDQTAKTRTKETKRTIGLSFVILSLRSMYLKEIL